MRNPIGTIGLALALTPALVACNSHPLKTVQLETAQEDEDNVALAVNRDVDILFVIDNSRSMALEQATLARNFGPLIERLEADDVRANFRIAVTTTDNGGPYCGTRDGGNFMRPVSCRSRPEDFQVTNSAGEVLEDYFDVACNEVCLHDDIEILPTSTHVDPEAKARPWIESIDGVTNIADGVDPVEAFQCFGPQGVTGCGFESPLETMRLGLTQAVDDDSEELGFMRPGAILAVVFVTDEADCSGRFGEVTDPWDIFNGSRALWSEENAAAGKLTSEVCWFAGVECEEQPDGSKECWAVDKAADGSEAQSPDEAVLHPLERYIDFLSRIEEEKQKINPEQELLVAVLTGVDTGYAGGPIHYSDGNDHDFLLDHGIGAGCVSANGKAAPPVRLAEVADAFRTDDDDVNLYSVCKEDYSDAMSAIADAIGQQVRPPCVQTCVADSDPLTDGLQHQCQLEEEYVDFEGRTNAYAIPPCEEGADGWEMPEEVDACYRSLTDAEGLTPETDDDMSPTCVDEGWNLELAIERREGVPQPPGAQVRARCSVSSLKSVDCPGLPG